MSNNWSIKPYGVLKDSTLAAAIYETGYAVAGKLDADTLSALNGLYKELHAFKSAEGGMFYSLYSKDINYRSRVHNEIGRLMTGVYENLFQHYKAVINSFIVKVPGPASEFYLHQDSTSLDEMNYSALSVWIPLQDTGVDNGCMFVMPKSHHLFAPYRSISFPAPFDSIHPLLSEYLKPIELKAGEILLFDNRIVHNSVANLSNADRVVAMSGIFPEAAKFITCYKDPNVRDNNIEIFEQEEDYLLTNTTFLEGCACRPEIGRSIGFAQWDCSQMSESRFLELVSEYGIEKINHPAIGHQTQMKSTIPEPVS